MGQARQGVQLVACGWTFAVRTQELLLQLVPVSLASRKRALEVQVSPRPKTTSPPPSEMSGISGYHFVKGISHITNEGGGGAAVPSNVRYMRRCADWREGL